MRSGLYSPAIDSTILSFQDSPLIDVVAIPPDSKLEVPGALCTLPLCATCTLGQSHLDRCRTGVRGKQFQRQVFVPGGLPGHAPRILFIEYAHVQKPQGQSHQTNPHTITSAFWRSTSEGDHGE